jgi:tetratricopeptide (TPR) repeat protein
MVLATTPERGTSGSPARAGRPPRRRRVLLAGGGLAASALLVAGVVLAGHYAGYEPDHAAPTAGATVTAPPSGPAAIQQLEARTASDPKDLPAWQELSRRYLQQAIATSDPAYYDLTRRALDRAAALAPGDHATTVTEGVLALSLHDFAGALEKGRTAHEQVAEDPDALAILVDASVELGHYDDAAAHVAELLERRPGSAALSRLSYLRELHGDLAGARLAMLQAEQATSAASDRATIATFVGDQLLAARDLAGAGSAYERAHGAQPGLATTDIGQARLQAAQGHLDDAIATVSAVVERTPAPAAATLLGELQRAAGRETDAAASFALAEAGTKLLVAAGSTVDLESAVFTADHGNPADAVALGQRAYAARQTVSTADALGWALTRSGRAGEGVPYVAEALGLGTRSPGLHVHAALAYAAVGQDPAAAAELQVAFTSSAWLVPALRADAAGLADRLGVTVPPDWRP